MEYGDKSTTVTKGRQSPKMGKFQQVLITFGGIFFDIRIFRIPNLSLITINFVKI